MFHLSFAWDRSKNKIPKSDSWVEGLWILGLLLAAVILFSINLGSLALRDWDEGTVAQVAREIASTPFGSRQWLYPTLWGEPYLNKPPLLHWLIAIAYKIGGVNEWTTRLPAAMLTAFSVPLLYGVGREIFKGRTPAIFSALIYLTLLPVVRHGRLAMLDGPVLCFLLLMIWCVLRSRRDLRWTLGAGIGLGLVWMTKGMMGLLLGAIAVVFLAWDTPRLLTSWHLWTGVFLGIIPVAAWYGLQWQYYGQQFINTGIMGQSLGRIWAPVENHQGPLWYYLLEILKYSWPWFLFWPQGWQQVWEHLNLSWAKLVLVWSAVYLVVISLMVTKLPWYVLPIYPAIALTAGIQLTEVYCYWPANTAYPRPWVFCLGLMSVVTTSACLYFTGLGTTPDFTLVLVCAAAAFTFFISAVLVAQREAQFIYILFWGSYVSLLLFVTSPHWIWELAEAYPVKPVAAMIRQLTPTTQPIYTSFAYNRPSLNFYSDRPVISQTAAQLQQHWQQDSQPYLLLDRPALDQLHLDQVKPLGRVSGWILVTRNP